MAVTAVALGASVLAGCGSSSSGPPTLTWYINPDSGGQAAVAAECTEAAQGKYRITTTLLPRDANSQREQLVRRLAAHDSSIDLMSLDPVFIPEFSQAGFLAPVPDDVAAAVTKDVVDSAVAGATWRDTLATVPFWANTQLLWYRKSAAKAAGLDMTKPVTWEQLIGAAKEQKRTLAVQGIRAESYTVWINALVASAGGSIVTNPEAKPDGIRLGLDSDAGKAAAAVVRDVATSGVAGPALSTQDENAGAALFQQKTGGFMVNWAFVWPLFTGAVKAGSLDQSVVDDIGWAQYPAVTTETPSKAPYGGINLGIGADSAHTDLALAAAQCIVTPEHQAAYFVSDGNPAANTTVYDDPEVLKAFPMAEAIRTSLTSAAPRPQTPYYNEISTGLQNTWHPAQSVDPDSSPGKAARKITAVLRKKDLL